MSIVLYWRKIMPGGGAFHTARVGSTSRVPVEMHGHDFAEVFWIDAGHGVHKVNGVAFPLRPGNLLMIRPADFHAIEPNPGETLQFTNIAFTRETADFLEQRYFAGDPWAFWSTGMYPVALEVEPAQLALFNRWADILAQAPRDRFHIERFLMNLLAELAPHSDDSLPEELPAWLLHACREIQKQEYFSQGVQAFYRMANRSREHVARSVKQLLGMTPTDFVNKARMDYAARQLEMSNRDIMEIAFDCGTENLSHFYSLFRKQFGVTPRSYRLSRHHVVPTAN